MVLSYYGHDRSEEEVSVLLGTIPYVGTPADRVQRVGTWGFDVWHPSTLQELRDALDGGLPPIVFLRAGPLDYWHVDDAHAVVLVGIYGMAVYLNDPFFEVFPQKTSLTSFLQAWSKTGHLAVTIRPTLRP
jgi:ABC-type bacteriocin/lantibiotic exporter with double-glycine peptidase domain